MSQLALDFVSTLKDGLFRAAVTDAAKWAERYRVLKGKNWVFDRHPWLYEVHTCNEWERVAQKAAQMGFTEAAMNVVFYQISELRRDVLYVLPTRDDASDFSSTRFDPALEESEFLQRLFSDVDNVKLKRAGSQCLYVRGSKSKSQLKSIPVAVAILDEVAEMSQENIPLVTERQAGQEEKVLFQLSTPTLANANINIAYQQSSQDLYTFRCPKCSRYVHLTFPDDLVVCGEHSGDPDIHKSHVKCPKCSGEIPHKQKAEILRHEAYGGSARYQSQVKNARYRGWNISQLYSMTKTPLELARSYFDAQIDPSYEQKFYNSEGGVVHEVKGARVSQEEIDSCIGNFTIGDIDTSKIRTLGCDVGRVLHVVIKEWKHNPKTNPSLPLNERSTCRIVGIFEIEQDENDFGKLSELMRKYRCMFGVIDAEPERRMALTFARKHSRRVYLCDYSSNQRGRQLTSATDQDLTVLANRTSWIDMVQSRYRSGTVSLPIDRPTDFDKHIKNIVRAYKEDKDGNPVGYYESTGPDHFCHADVYAEIAYQFRDRLAVARTIY